MGGLSEWMGKIPSALCEILNSITNYFVLIKQFLEVFPLFCPFCREFVDFFRKMAADSQRKYSSSGVSMLDAAKKSES